MWALRARIDSEWPRGQEETFEPQPETMRAWLVKGTHRFTVDPRRRFGRHAEARRLLAADDEVTNGHSGAWGGLVSALQRHTVHSELARLPKQDRQILSLAYVHGHTNREIAAMLQVSVRTVGRRMTLALARLEESARRAGAWASALVLLGLAAYSRWVATARSGRWPSGLAMAAAGTVTVVAVGVSVATPAPTEATQGPAPVVAMPIQVPLPAEHPFSTTVGAVGVTVSADTKPAKGHAGDGPAHAANQAPVTASRICGGNPTDAPPVTPVGPRGAGPHTPPVTTPPRGGCGHRQ